MRSYLLAVLGGNATAQSMMSTIWLVVGDKSLRECPTLVDELKVRFKHPETGISRVRLRSSLDATSDFAFLAAASTLVLTFQGVQTSSYGWWAAFLGRAKQVHMPLNLCTFPWWHAKFASFVAPAEDGQRLGRKQPTIVFDQPTRYVYHDLEARRYFGTLQPSLDRVVWPPVVGPTK